MLLSGVVITIAFVLTALTLAQVSSLERAAASDRSSPLGEEWRFLHERLGTNLRVAVTSDLSNTTFVATTFPTIVATFRNIEAEKGYDTVIRLAGNESAVNKTERDLVSAALYNAHAVDGSVKFDWAWDYVGDGILWRKPCPDITAPAAGCIGGVLVYVYLSDGASSIEEVILFPVNTS